MPRSFEAEEWNRKKVEGRQIVSSLLTIRTRAAAQTKSGNDYGERGGKGRAQLNRSYARLLAVDLYLRNGQHPEKFEKRGIPTSVSAWGGDPRTK